MGIDKDDLEEIGEAVERLGQMVEKQFTRFGEVLNSLSNSLIKIGEQHKKVTFELLGLKNQMTEIKDFEEGLDQRITRLEEKINELYKNIALDKGGIEKLEKHLFSLKKNLEFFTQATQEILGQKKFLDRKKDSLDD